MSKTVVAQAYGSPEVLALVDVEVPSPQPGEVAVDLKAIGVNPFDVKLYSGAFGTDPAKLPIRLGGEATGVVSAIGDGVVGVAPGDEVIVSPGTGLYAEQVVVPVSSLTAKPAALDWEHAAGLLLVGGTAADALTTVAVTAGDTVLIHGASGAVGSIAVQLALFRGATVIGTAGESNQEYVRSLGAVAVPYGDGLEQRVRDHAPGGVDAAVDTAGTDEAIDASLALVADTSRIVTIAAFGRAQADGFHAISGGTATSVETRLNAREELVRLAGNGSLDTKVAKTFPLTEVARAHTELTSSHPAGKFILIP